MVGSPTPRGVAGLRSIFRAIATACSERPPPGRHARDGTADQCALRRARPAGSPTPAQAACTPQVEIGRSENSAARSAQCVGVAATQLERFLPHGTGRSESAPTRRAGNREATRRPISAAQRRRRRAGRSSPPVSASHRGEGRSASRRRRPRLNRAASCRSGCRRSRTRCLRRWRRRPSLHRRPTALRRCRTDRTRRHSAP